MITPKSWDELPETVVDANGCQYSLLDLYQQHTTLQADFIEVYSNLQADLLEARLVAKRLYELLTGIVALKHGDEWVNAFPWLREAGQ